MAKYPCRRCIYFNACGDNMRTAACEGRALRSSKQDVCVICGKPIDSWGNNPWPVKDYGLCCDACNEALVIPARVEIHRQIYRPSQVCGRR